MDALSAYRYYLTLKTHFHQPSFDYFKYHKILGTPEALEKRNDQTFFWKLGKHKAVPSFILSNVSIKSYSVVDLVNEYECQRNYQRWQTVQQAMTYHLSQDLNKLNDDFDSEIFCNGQLPKLLVRFLSEEINRETLCLILGYNNLVIDWNNQLAGNVIWENIKLPIIRYIPFVKKSQKNIALLDEKFPKKKYK